MPGQASKQYAVKKTESGSTVGELRSNKLKQRWDELYEKQKLTAQFMERLMRHIVVKDDMDDKSKLEYERLITVIRSLFIYMCVFAAIVGTFENWSALNSIWWAYVTITTIGYGDVTPATTPGMLLTLLYILIGMGYATEAISNVLQYYLAQLRETIKAKGLKEQMDKEAQYEKEIILSTTKNFNRLNTFSRDSIVINNRKTTTQNRDDIQLSNQFSKYLLYTFVLILLFSNIMHINEGWDIITSVYFTFVTTLTIGFGDQANFYGMHGVNVTNNATLQNNCVQSKGFCMFTSERNCDGNLENICNCTISDKGKIFIMIYWVLSFATLSNALSSMPQHIFEKLYRFFRCKNKKKVKVDSTVNSNVVESQEPFARKLTIAFGLYLLVLLYAFLGGFIFVALEPDTFDLITGFYFSMVSLTTIGYGDITPVQPSVRLIWVLFVLIGFVFVGIVINHFNQLFANIASKMKRIWYKIFQKIGYNDVIHKDELLNVLTSVVFIILFTFINAIFIVIFECSVDEYDTCGNKVEECKWHVGIGIYFAIVTMSTLGYGATYYPATRLGKIWISFFSVIILSNFTFFLESYITYQVQKSVTLISLKMKSEDFQTGMDDFRKTIAIIEEKMTEIRKKEKKKLVEVEEAGDEEVVSTV